MSRGARTFGRVTKTKWVRGDEAYTIQTGQTVSDANLIFAVACIVKNCVDWHQNQWRREMDEKDRHTQASRRDMSLFVVGPPFAKHSP